MHMSDFFNNIFSSLKNIPFDTLILTVWGSFGAIFVLSLALCIFTTKIKTASKRPFLCLVNAFTAVTLAAFLTANELPQSVLATALFWFAGYFAYGVLCFFTQPARPQPAAPVAISALPAAVPQQKAGAGTVIRTDTPAAKSSLRLEHAISVTDKLLQKNLGKGDRQELEKLKNTLAVLQMKGTLSPAESDILNDNFNALLKLMAKYNV